MKLVLKRESLVDALGAVRRVVPGHAVRPIFRCVLLEAKPGGVVDVRATDLDVGIRHTMVADSVEGDGAVALPCATLLGILGEGQEDVATLETKGTTGVLTVGRGRFEIIGADPEDFPAMPGMPDGALVDVPCEDLAVMIDRTIFAVASGVGRYSINGLYLRCAAGLLELVGTDGHRLAYYMRKHDGTSKLEGVIIPASTCRHVRRLCSGLAAGESVRFGLQGNQLLVAGGPVVIASSLVEGVFPKYKQVIPKDCNLVATIKREAMKQALRKAGYLANDDAKAVTLTFRSGSCRVNAESESKGVADVCIEAEYAGEEFSLQLNQRYLIDGLEAMAAENVKMEMQDGARPIIVREGSDYLYVQMPIVRT